MSLTDSKRNKTYVNKYDKNQRVAGSTFSLSKYKQWEKLYKSGGNMRKKLPTLTIGEYKKFLAIYKKRN
jgi:hypothetical protein